jgi:hypothetical protein
MNYPTQAFVKEQIRSGKWPAKEGEVLDIRSLSDREVKIIELYNQEEIIKQLRKLNANFGNNTSANDVIDDLNRDNQDSYLQGIKDFASDFLDDGRVNGSNKKRKE